MQKLSERAREEVTVVRRVLWIEEDDRRGVVPGRLAACTTRGRIGPPPPDGFEDVECQNPSSLCLE